MDKLHKSKIRNLTYKLTEQFSMHSASIKDRAKKNAKKIFLLTSLMSGTL